MAEIKLNDTNFNVEAEKIQINEAREVFVLMYYEIISVLKDYLDFFSLHIKICII